MERELKDTAELLVGLSWGFVGCERRETDAACPIQRRAPVLSIFIRGLSIETGRPHSGFLSPRLNATMIGSPL